MPRSAVRRRSRAAGSRTIWLTRWSRTSPDASSTRWRDQASTIPPAAIESFPAERALTASVEGAEVQVLEFMASIGGDGPTRGSIRLGYFRPPAGIALAELPFLGTLALAVFLLTPIFYLLVRNEIRPMRTIMTDMEKIVGGQRAEPAAPEAGATLAALLQRLNDFAAAAQSRLNALEADNTRLLTSGKLLAYQKQRLESVMEALPDAVLLFDESGTAIFANAKVRVVRRHAGGGRRPDLRATGARTAKIVDFIVQRSQGKSRRTAARRVARVQAVDESGQDLLAARLAAAGRGRDDGANRRLC